MTMKMSTKKQLLDRGPPEYGRDVILDELMALQKENEYGEVTPQAIVDRARSLPDDHPLHQRFCWDDAVEANRGRLAVARALLGRYQTKLIVKRERKTIELQVPMFHHSPLAAAASRQGYITIHQLRRPDQKELAHAAVMAAIGRAISFLVNARSLAAVLGHEKLIDEAIRRLERDRAMFTVPVAEAAD